MSNGTLIDYNPNHPLATLYLMRVLLALLAPSQIKIDIYESVVRVAISAHMHIPGTPSSPTHPGLLINIRTLRDGTA